MIIAPAGLFAGAIYFLSESALSWRRRAARHHADDKGSLPVIWVTGFVAVSLAFVTASAFPLANVSVLKDMPAIGLVVFGLGVGLRWYAILYLGRFFTVNVAIVDNHRLIDTGPYRWLRHPSYTGWLIAVAGLGLCLGNGLSLAIVLGVTTSLVLWRIGIEEAVLRQAFGDAYAAYARRTARLVPFVF